MGQEPPKTLSSDTLGKTQVTLPDGHTPLYRVPGRTTENTSLEKEHTFESVATVDIFYQYGHDSGRHHGQKTSSPFPSRVGSGYIRASSTVYIHEQHLESQTLIKKVATGSIQDKKYPNSVDGSVTSVTHAVVSQHLEQCQNARRPLEIKPYSFHDHTHHESSTRDFLLYLMTCHRSHHVS